MKPKTRAKLNRIMQEYKALHSQYRAEGLNFFPAIDKAQKELIPKYGAQQFHRATSHLLYYNTELD